MSQALRHSDPRKLDLRLATRLLALLAGIFCAWQNFATDAQAKITHVVFADGKAAIDIDDAIWIRDSDEDGTISYSCARSVCPVEVLLRLRSRPLDKNEETFTRARLLRLWTGLIVDARAEGSRIGSIVRARRIKLGAGDGVAQRLRVTAGAVGKPSFETRLFSTPHSHMTIEISLTSREPVKGDLLTRMQRTVLPMLKLN